jgi:hypothetical protein
VCSLAARDNYVSSSDLHGHQTIRSRNTSKHSASTWSSLVNSNHSVFLSESPSISFPSSDLTTSFCRVLSPEFGCHHLPNSRHHKQTWMNGAYSVLSRGMYEYVTVDGVWIGDHLQVVTTNNYNTTAVSILYNSLEHSLAFSAFLDVSW